MKREKERGNFSLNLFLMGGLLMAVMSVASAASDAQPVAENASKLLTNNYGRAEEVFDFPDDHILHQPESVVEDIENFIEWLYWTGSLEDVETGDLYGFQYTLFHQNLVPGQIGYVNHVAISDVHNSQHPRNRYVTFLDQADISNGTDDDKGPYWRYQDAQTTLTYWEDLDAWKIESQGNVSNDGGHGQNISMNLTLVNDKAYYFLEFPDGVTSMGACAEIDPESMVGKTYYYSHPAMTTTGTLTIDGREIQVQGDGWFDHQWGGYNECYPAWDWFSLRLDDGSFIMLFNFKDMALNDIPDQRGLTYLDPKGRVRWLYGEKAANLTITRWWTSDLFGFSYPVEWIIDTPMGKYALEPYFDEQTMNVDEGEVKYWEGIMRVREKDHTGEQIGVGYMELASYAPIFSVE